MTVLIADTETNGLLHELDRIHCLCLMAPKDHSVLRFHDEPDLCPRDGTMRDGLALLAEADERWFHNGIGFDDPAIRKVYPDWRPKGVMRDSLIIGRTVWPDEHLKGLDAAAMKRRPDFPKNLIGRHSLEAWGYRLKNQKGQKPDSWARLTPETIDYCAQDVMVLAALRDRILASGPTLAQIELEQAFAPIVQRQIDRGFRLDVGRVNELVGQLMRRRAELDTEIRAAFEDFTDEYVTPKKQLRKTRKTVFNPNSRAHIARALGEKHGWKPTAFTPGGQARVDEGVIGALEYPEAKLLAERLKIQKRLGTIAEGDGAWLKLVRVTGRVHGYMAHNAAVTSRCTHSKPNLGNIEKPPEMRRCWVASPGNRLVIMDVKGIQARILAHYAYPYDGGDFARLVLEGDIHSQNQAVAAEILGRPASRDAAKVAFYAMLFGAKGPKVGKSFGVGPHMGERIRTAILGRLPGLASVVKRAEADSKAYGWLPALDGRRLWVRDQHTALVTLAQGGEAICMKQAIVYAQPWTRDYQVMVVHDEVVLDIPESLADAAASALKASVIASGVRFKLRVPLDSKVVVGYDWSSK